MTLSLEQLSSRMRRGEDIPLRETAQVVLALSVPSILQQMVVTAMEYIDAAMVGHIGAEATAAIGIVSSSTWLLHGILVGLYTAFSIQIAQYLGADRQADARGVLRQAMLFNLILGLAAAGFGIGISRFLPGWLGADLSLQANASAYFAIWSAALPFTMAMGMYAAMLRASGDALTRRPHQRAGLRAGRRVQLFPHQPHPDAAPLRHPRHRLGCRAGRSGCGAGHRPGQLWSAACWPSAILLLSGGAPLHPEARLVENHPRLPARNLWRGGRAAGRRARGPLLGAGGARCASSPSWARWPLRPTVWA